MIVKFASLVEPVTTLADSKFLESHTNVRALREYCRGELSVSVKEVDSVPELEGGITRRVLRWRILFQL